MREERQRARAHLSAGVTAGHAVPQPVADEAVRENGGQQQPSRELRHAAVVQGAAAIVPERERVVLHARRCTPPLRVVSQAAPASKARLSTSI